MKFLPCILFFLSSFSLFSQDYLTVKTADEKAVENYKLGNKCLYNMEFEKAIDFYDKALKKNSKFVEAINGKADAYSDMGKKEQAVKLYQEVVALAPEYRPKVFISLGNISFENKKYEEAANYYEKFLTYYKEEGELINSIKFKLENAKFLPKALANPLPIKPVNMGSGVNSEGLDYHGMPTADGRFFIFSRQVGDQRDRQEDIFFSEYKDKQWQPAKPIIVINTERNEGAHSISANGKYLVFVSEGYEDCLGRNDLYLSEARNGTWSTPKNMSVPVNSKFRETQPALSANGDMLIFASDRPGSKGDLDLWLTQKNKDGKWTKPKNLSDLNTASEDGSPFLHEDGQTLYFRSKGLPGFGGHDLYMSKLQPDSSWSKPVNVGTPLNTPGDEGLLSVALDGKTGYYFTDSGEGGFGKWDLYSFEMPESIRPSAATYIKAIVYDAETKKPISLASAELVSLGNGRLFAKSITDSDGSFLTCLPIGNSYALNVKANGYMFASENFDLVSNSNIDEPFVKEIYLQKLKTETASTTTSPINSKPVILKNVFFATASAVLKPESKTELDILKKMLEDNPNIKIQLNGHTDNVGGESDNLTLSQARAEAVRTYLTAAGIAAERMTAKGFGESQPISTNDTAEGRANNRRTEFQIL